MIGTCKPFLLSYDAITSTVTEKLSLPSTYSKILSMFQMFVIFFDSIREKNILEFT